MNSLRKVLGFLMATATLAAFALSSGTAFGGDKQYTLAMSPTTGTSLIATMTATLTNKGNSSFNSFTLALPANYSLLGTPTISASKGTVSYSAGIITVTDIGLPVGSGSNEAITVTMSNVATSGASCGTGVSRTWTASVWTGSSLNGNQFSQTGPAATTSIAPLCYTVTSSIDGTGNGSGTISPPSVTVQANATAAFTVTTATGSSVAVTSTCGGSLVGTTFTTGPVVASGCVVKAKFTLNSYPATSSVDGTGNGSGTITPPSQSILFGSPAVFTVTTATGSSVAVTSSCGGSLAGTTYTTGAVGTAGCAVSAKFTLIPYTLTYNAGSGGTITGTTPQTVNYGASGSQVTAKPNAGYHFVSWSDTLTTIARTDTGVTGNLTVTASFAADTYSLAYSSGPNPRTAFAGTSTSGVPLTLSFSGGPGGATSASNPTILAPAGVTIKAIAGFPTGTTFDAGAIFLPASTPLGTAVTGTVDVASACTHASGSWGFAADPPGFVQSGTSPGFTIQNNCSLQATAPSVAVSGKTFNVTVTALDGNGAPITNFTGPVTFSVASGSGTVAPTTPIVCGAATPCPVTITLPTGSQVTPVALRASSSFGNTALSVTATPTITVWPGILFCGDPLDQSILNPNNLPDVYPPLDPNAGLPVPGWAGDGKRGLFNKDGSPCVLVNYTFTNNILVDNSVTLRWDTNVQPNAAFRYSMNWKPEWADPATGLPVPGDTKVLWFDRLGTPTPKVPGRACIGGAQLPAPYGTLTGLTSGPDTITIGALFPTGSIAVPTVFPFAIFIGDGTATERLLVTGLASGSTYNVLRAQGGTTAVTPVIGTALVMSNPLPLDGSGNQMQVCLADEGFVGVPANLCTKPAPSFPPPACLVETTTVLDVGDGGVSRSP